MFNSSQRKHHGGAGSTQAENPVFVFVMVGNSVQSHVDWQVRTLCPNLPPGKAEAKLEVLESPRKREGQSRPPGSQQGSQRLRLPFLGECVEKHRCCQISPPSPTTTMLVKPFQRLRAIQGAQVPCLHQDTTGRPSMVPWSLPTQEPKARSPQSKHPN